MSAKNRSRCTHILPLIATNPPRLQNRSVRLAVRTALLGGAVAAMTGVAYAQEAGPVEEVVVTGTRIRQPGVVSSSPIYSVTSEEIRYQQEPELEKILRLLPITVPGDNQNVNNGTEGATTIDLRGLGPQRNLVLINGKRAVPYNDDGEVDVSMIPTALIERVDIITGGASAVYGSDAISGALNVILRDDFEGVDIQMNNSRTGDSDGDDRYFAVTLGTNAADGRGNIVLGLTYQNREAVLLGARPLGQVGISTADGAGYQEFLNGEGPIPAPEGCGGPGSVAVGGSTTTLPTRINIAGGPGLGQFRDDGTLGSNCGTFNFNPFNFYQTPLERYTATVLGNLELADNMEVYTMFNYGKSDVQQQVAASGVFGNPYFTPLANPLISDQARQVIIDAAEAGRLAGTVNVANTPDPDNPGDVLFHNWIDTNGNGIVDADPAASDELNIQYRRRTVEMGNRTEDYNNELFQVTLGLRGDLTDTWSYDASFQYGETNRVLYRAGYTNLASVEHAVRTLDGVTCLSGGPGCVPINLFGGFGSITPEMALYSGATALQEQNYEQLIVNAFVAGSFENLQLPAASTPVAFSFGAEHRDERAELIPDECLKLAPDSCLGGAGGYLLPIDGGYDVSELFAEMLIPVLDGNQALDIELGYRYSDYDPSGSDDTWKAGLNWRPVDSLMFRLMRQRAARAPNVDELSSPQVQGLDNARMDPCSISNAANITPELQQRCMATGMSAAQVGTVEDIVVGQIDIIEGTDLDNLPGIEQADTTTVGFVWTPQIGRLLNPVFSLDYYDIDITDPIEEFSPQEIMDACYERDILSECDKIRRVGGTLTLPGAGVELFTRNKVFLRAEGIELGFNFGIEVGPGDLNFSGTVNKYLTHEFQSIAGLPVVDCNGYYGTSCQAPRPDLRFIQRTTWNWNNLSLSALWRHIGEVNVEPPERAGVFPAFHTIDSYDYLDLYASYRIRDRWLLSFGAANVTDEDPPIVGNEAASTSFNSGNTFPALYDTLGRIYTLQLNITF